MRELDDNDTDNSLNNTDVYKYYLFNAFKLDTVEYATRNLYFMYAYELLTTLSMPKSS